MPHEHPPPPPPPGNTGATLWYVNTVLNGNYTDDAKIEAIKKATE